VLSKYFSGIGAKRLSEVEIEPTTSNQHEFNGISDFKKIFGTEKINFKGHFIYLADNEERIAKDSGTLTWYDARENHPKRTEYRLYYSTNQVVNKAVTGDLVVIGRTGNNNLVVIVAEQGSTSEQQLLWLFGLEEVANYFIVRDFNEEDIKLSYAGNFIITSLGFEIPETAPDFLDDLIRNFGKDFPTSLRFSEYARSTLSEASPIYEPDNTLIAWLEREELLFKTLEKHIVAEKLAKGFGINGTDVDEFVSYSLSIQNRRKARAGLAFENHLAFIFGSHHISFSKGARTERNNKPDFIFPDIQNYHTPGFPHHLLTMLGVKTTAKDRWRQVLSEADRITNKHLITLEPAISENQTTEMAAQNLQLVLPQPLMSTYSEDQQRAIQTLSEFIAIVLDRQKRING